MKEPVSSHAPLSLDLPPGITLKVLVADDDPMQRKILDKRLSHVVDLRLAEDGVEAWAQYQADPADVLLVDWMMPNMDGLELCRLVKAAPRFSYVILMTVRGELDDKIDALECGVDEYLVKPVDHRELGARIRAAARIIAANRALEAESRTDRLTALKNRRAFEETLAYEVARATRSGKPFCLIFGDVDHFKSVNDRYGHRVGDHLLTAVGAALGQTLRKTDHVFRIGGDEFAMILPDCPLGACSQWTARMRAAMGGVQIPDLDHPVGLSLGMVVFDPARPVPIEDLIGKADEQMYLAKRSSSRTV